MRKYVICLLALLLSGCGSSSGELEQGMQLRTRLLQTGAVSFTARVTADYDGRLFSYSADCAADSSGGLTFTMTEPDTVAGISGSLAGAGGKILFEDVALDFPLGAEDLPSPVSAPWILLRALRSGYLSSSCEEEGKVRLSLEDSFEDDPLRVDVWLDSSGLPECADILNDGRRILTVDVTNFVLS